MPEQKLVSDQCRGPFRIGWRSVRSFLHALVLLATVNPSDVFSQYTLNGSAQYLGNDCYAVTPNLAWQNGSVWYSDQIDLSQDVEIQFFMNLGSNDVNGADGIVMAFHQQGPNSLGLPGGGLGFEGFSPSLGIEFDTYTNTDYFDPNVDHIGIQTNGIVNHGTLNNLAGPIQASVNSANVEDGNDHVVKFKWQAAPQLLEIYFDCELRLSLNYDLVGTLFDGNPLVTWGFTSATGGLTNLQSVCLDPLILGLEPEYIICNGQEVVLAAQGSLNGNYTWAPTTDLSDPGSQSTIASPDQTTEYTVTFTDLCGVVTTESTIVQVLDPELDLGPDLDLCEGESLEIQLETQPDFSYLWSDGSSEPSQIVEAGELVWVDLITDGCTLRDSLFIEALALPASDVLEDQSICEGELASFTINLANTEVIWPDNSNGNTFNTPDAGTFSYTLTNTSSQCSTESEVSVEVTPYPELSLPAEVLACEGEVILLDAGGDAESYLWSTNASTSQIEVVDIGSYSVTASNGNCAVSADTEVSISPTPQPDLGTDLELCTGESVTLEVDIPGTTNEWSDGSSGTMYTTTQPGLISVDVTDLLSGCTGTDWINLSYLSFPQPGLPAEITLCEGEDVVLQSGQAQNYQWNSGETTASITVSEAGNYIVEASNGGCTASDSTLINVNPVPEVDLGPDRSFCEGESFEISIEDQGYLYSWNGEQGSTTFSTTEEGEIVLIATDAETGCAATDAMILSEEPQPEIMLPSFQRICEEYPQPVEAVVEFSDSVFWSDGTTGTELSPELDGIYTLTAENDCGTDAAQVEVVIERCECNAFVPNAFTPNQDGHNDVFGPVIDCDIYDYRFQIFNRWGQRVFESADPSESWPGDHRSGSHFVPDGLYVWRLEFKSLATGEIRTFEHTGHVSILR